MREFTIHWTLLFLSFFNSLPDKKEKKGLYIAQIYLFTAVRSSDSLWRLIDIGKFKKIKKTIQLEPMKDLMMFAIQIIEEISLLSTQYYKYTRPHL